MARVAALKFALTSFLLAAALSAPGLAQARSRTDRPAHGNLATIAVSEMPRQGRETYETIRRGGPFRYDKDGSVFGNGERLLPAEKRRYYREYTVPTLDRATEEPGASCAGGPSGRRMPVFIPLTLRQFSKNCGVTKK